MEMCPFLTKPEFIKKEEGEKFYLKIVPCQKEKCFVYSDGKCGLVYKPDYSRFFELLSDLRVSIEENVKALYDELKSFKEEIKSVERPSEEKEKIVMEIKEKINELKVSLNESFNRLLLASNKNYENLFNYFESFIKEKEKNINEIMEQERKGILEIFENLKGLTDSIKEFKDKMDETLKNERSKRKFEEARFYYLKGDYKEAESILKELLEERKEDSFILLMGLSLLGQKKFDEAEKYFSEYIEKHPEVPEALASMSQILLEKGEVDRALEYILKAKEKSPDSEDILYTYGIILVKKGEIEKAKGVFEEILKINPHFEPAKDAIKKYIIPSQD